MYKTYVFNDNDINNLIYFLDKVSITGHNERAAMNQIINALNSPINNDQNNNLVEGEEDDC